MNYNIHAEFFATNAVEDCRPTLHHIWEAAFPGRNRTIGTPVGSTFFGTKYVYASDEADLFIIMRSTGDAGRLAYTATDINDLFGHSGNQHATYRHLPQAVPNVRTHMAVVTTSPAESPTAVEQLQIDRIFGAIGAMENFPFIAYRQADRNIYSVEYILSQSDEVKQYKMLQKRNLLRAATHGLTEAIRHGA